MNILQTLQGGALSAGIGLIEAFQPKLKPAIDAVQQDIADGKITPENIDSTVDALMTTAEGYVPAVWDPVCEQIKVATRALVELEQRIVTALQGQAAPAAN